MLYIYTYIHMISKFLCVFGSCNSSHLISNHHQPLRTIVKLLPFEGPRALDPTPS